MTAIDSGQVYARTGFIYVPFVYSVISTMVEVVVQKPTRMFCDCDIKADRSQIYPTNEIRSPEPCPVYRQLPAGKRALRKLS